MATDDDIIYLFNTFNDKFGGSVTFQNIIVRCAYHQGVIQIRVTSPWGQTDTEYVEWDQPFIKTYSNGSYTYTVNHSLYCGTEITALNCKTTYVQLPTTGSIICKSFNEDGVEMPGALIFKNGVNTRLYTPATITDQPAGAYNINFEKTGYSGCNVNVTVVAGSSITAQCNLVSVPTTGSLSITSTPTGAAIFLDSLPTGKLTGAAPVILSNLGPGTHTIVFVKIGYLNCTVQQDVIVGESRDVHCNLVIPAPGFDITINIPSIPPGTKLYVSEVIKIPFTDIWYYPPFAPHITWSDITNRQYLARTSPYQCDPAPSSFANFREGKYYTVHAGDPITAFHPGDRVHLVTDAITPINITSLAAVPGWLSELCGWFDVAEADCATSFYTALPDIGFASESLSIIFTGKSSYPPYESKTPTIWNLIDVALVFIPLGVISDISKVGLKAVKGNALYPELVQNFIRFAKWDSARFPEKKIGFLEVMWDLQGHHLDEVVSQLEIGNVDEAMRLVTLYLPAGVSPDLAVKNLGTFTKNLFNKLPTGTPEILIKDAGLENSFKNTLGGVIYNSAKPTTDAVADINEIFTLYPNAKKLIKDESVEILSNPASTPDQMGRIINSVENYPAIVEDIGDTIPLENIDELVTNAVNMVGYENTRQLTKTLFSRSLYKSLASPVPITFTAPQTEAIINIIKKDPIGFSNAMAEFDVPFRVKYVNSLKQSGTTGIDAINHSEGVIDASRYADTFEAFGYDIDEVVKAFTYNQMTMPEFWSRLGIDAIELAGSGRVIEQTPSQVTSSLANLAEETLSRETARALVMTRLMADSITQIIARGTITPAEVDSLKDLYNRFPVDAGKALDLLSPTQLSSISTLLNNSTKGKIVEQLWGFRTKLRAKIDPNVADEVLEFWIKTNGETLASKKSLQKFLISNWKIFLPLGVTAVSLPLFYLVFEAAMIKYLGTQYGFLPSTIYTRMDDVIDKTYACNAILKTNPQSEEGFHLAQEIVAEMNYLINYVIEHPIPEDVNLLDIANAYWGPGVGSLNAETLAHFQLTRDLFIEQIETVTGKVLVAIQLPEEISAEVTAIVDGDTVDIEYAGNTYRVRMLGFNTPESGSYDNYKCIPGDQPFLVRRLAIVGGSCADEEIFYTDQSNYDQTVAWIGAAGNLPARAFATFKSDLDDQFDDYGRFLGLPFNAAGENIGLKSLTAGQSTVFFYKPNKQIIPADYLAAELIAKNADIGIWPFSAESGWVRFTCNIAIAEIWIDNILIDTTSSGIRLLEVPIGIHSYKFKKLGYIGCSGSFEIDIEHIESNPLPISCVLETESECPIPNASFTQTATTIIVGQSITFNATASSAGTDQTIVGYDWDFKDGATATGVVTSHAFSSPGTYSIELTITNSCGETNTDLQIITVTSIICPAPNASFTQSDTTPDVGQYVTFDATASNPGTGKTIVSYNWLWGDGGYLDTTTPSGIHRFDTPGVFVVQLTVTNSCGESNVDTQIITVSAITELGSLTVKTYSAPGVLLTGVVLYLNNVDKGAPPVTINNIPIGSHSVRLEKSGYLGCAKCEGVACTPGATISPCDFNVVISKDVVTTLEVTMQKVFPIEISSDPTGAVIKIDGISTVALINLNRIEPNLIEQILTELQSTTESDTDIFFRKLKKLK